MAKVKCPKCAHLNDSNTTLCSRCEAVLPNVSFEGARQPPTEKPKSPREGEDLLFRRGQVVNNRYTVLDLIGRGGMGCIYKVHDNVLGEDLALKTLLPQFVTDKMVVDRFLNEARITRKLAHPNIVRVHDIGMTGKGIYISMEYVQGDSLRGLLEKQHPGERIPVRQVLHVIDQLCIALEYAHQYTIHRDIKPENIMITRENTIKLMDFGISKLMDNRFATSASIVMGTPYYMSPEQLRSSRNVDARADIYSIGVVLYELLTGNMPTGIPRPASEMIREVPPALDDIVAKCVDPDLEKRFRTTSELREAIRPIIEMLDEGKDPKRTLARKLSKKRRGPLLSMQYLAAAGCIIAALAAISAGLWALETWNKRATETAAPAVPTLAPEHAERYLELSAMIEAVRGKTAALSEPTRTQREQMEIAATRLREATEKHATGSGEAVPLAEESLELYLAALLAPPDMVFVPSGTVTADGILHRVPAFFIDRTEVTLKEFAAFCRQVEGGWPLQDELGGAVETYGEYPVNYVAWFDAQAYAVWKGKLLPTREQWARAAYGGPQAPDMYPWGTEWKPDGANVQTEHSRPVRSFNSDVVWSGCFDMAGNVMEWTRSPATVGAPDAFPDFGESLHVCGGSYLQAMPLRDAAKRAFETRAPDLGFRCVREISLAPEAVAAALNQLDGTPARVQTSIAPPESPAAEQRTAPAPAPAATTTRAESDVRAIGSELLREGGLVDRVLDTQRTSTPSERRDREPAPRPSSVFRSDGNSRNNSQRQQKPGTPPGQAGRSRR